MTVHSTFAGSREISVRSHVLVYIPRIPRKWITSHNIWAMRRSRFLRFKTRSDPKRHGTEAQPLIAFAHPDSNVSLDLRCWEPARRLGMWRPSDSSVIDRGLPVGLQGKLVVNKGRTAVAFNPVNATHAAYGFLDSMAPPRRPAHPAPRMVFDMQRIRITDDDYASGGGADLYNFATVLKAGAFYGAWSPMHDRFYISHSPLEALVSMYRADRLNKNAWPVVMAQAAIDCLSNNALAHNRGLDVFRHHHLLLQPLADGGAYVRLAQGIEYTHDAAAAFPEWQYGRHCYAVTRSEWLRRLNAMKWGPRALSSATTLLHSLTLPPDCHVQCIPPLSPAHIESAVVLVLQTTRPHWTLWQLTVFPDHSLHPWTGAAATNGARAVVLRQDDEPPFSAADGCDKRTQIAGPKGCTPQTDPARNVGVVVFNGEDRSSTMSWPMHCATGRPLPVRHDHWALLPKAAAGYVNLRTAVGDLPTA